MDIHLTNGLVTLRPLAREDALLLLKWLTDPRVLDYWEGRSYVCTPEIVQEHFFDDDPRASRCIIQFGGQDIGYIHAYKLDEEMFEEYEYPRKELTAFGIDQFIGEPELWGQGIGRQFLGLICDFLHDSCGAQAIVLDPHADNPRAIRCYEACGFRKLKFLPKHELHDGVMVDCWLMAKEYF